MAARAKRMVRLADGLVVDDRRVVDVADAPPVSTAVGRTDRRDGMRPRPAGAPA